jgi:hypothetical protein
MMLHSSVPLFVMLWRLIVMMVWDDCGNIKK